MVDTLYFPSLEFLTIPGPRLHLLSDFLSSVSGYILFPSLVVGLMVLRIRASTARDMVFGY